jgi:hypothetical protein
MSLPWQAYPLQTKNDKKIEPLMRFPCSQRTGSYKYRLPQVIGILNCAIHLVAQGYEFYDKAVG